MVNSRRQEVIGVTLFTTSVSNLSVGWKVRDEETLSDHRQIEFDLVQRLQLPLDYQVIRGKLTGVNLLKYSVRL